MSDVNARRDGFDLGLFERHVAEFAASRRGSPERQGHAEALADSAGAAAAAIRMLRNWVNDAGVRHGAVGPTSAELLAVAGLLRATADRWDEAYRGVGVGGGHNCREFAKMEASNRLAALVKAVSLLLWEMASV